jgi:putative membrane-bound dehydrogenase-like protein
MRVPAPARLSAAALGCLALSAGAQIRDDNEALKRLKIPEGFEIRLFAGSDICHNPTALDVDVYGRVWVCEGVNYRTTISRNQPGPVDPEADRIKVYEDTDGDGKADKVSVFVTKIPVVPMAIAIAGDKAYWGYPPNIYVSGGADSREPKESGREALLKGFKGLDHDHAIHGFSFGPDGRLYFTVGDQGYDVTDKSGVRHQPRAASMVRVNPDGTRMRVLADNFRNPYELSVDGFGRVFCSDNDDDGNAQVRIAYVIDGGNYGYTGQGGTPASPTRHHWREDVPGITPKILRTYAGSPCGILCYEGNLLPERFRGSLIHCDNGAPQAVRAYHMKPHGAGAPFMVR